jgi:hypothetical protein
MIFLSDYLIEAINKIITSLHQVVQHLSPSTIRYVKEEMEMILSQVRRRCLLLIPQKNKTPPLHHCFK